MRELRMRDRPQVQKARDGCIHALNNPDTRLEGTAGMVRQKLSDWLTDQLTDY